MIIFFIGMKHCGKSTHGRAYANWKQWNFIDTDDWIVEAAHRQTGADDNVRSLFNRIGAAEFARLEEQAMDRLRQLKCDTVVSTGGRMPVNNRIQEQLREFGLKVYLQLAPEILFERVKRRGLPSFLDPARPLESFIELYRQREPYYLRIADVVIPLDDLPREAAQKIIFRKIEEKL